MDYFTLEPGDEFQLAFSAVRPDGQVELSAWQKIRLQGDMRHKPFRFGPALPAHQYITEWQRKVLQSGYIAASPSVRVKTRGQIWYIMISSADGESLLARIGRGFGPQGVPRKGFEQLEDEYDSTTDALGHAIREIKDRAHDPDAEQTPSPAPEP